MKTTRILLLVMAVALAACAGPTTGSQPTRGPVYIDSADLLVLESFPIQLNLVLAGHLPTPCHKWHYEIEVANAQNQIHVTLYSSIDPAVTCLQVLHPFNQAISIPLDGLPDGDYSLWLNGELVGEFSYPG